MSEDREEKLKGLLVQIMSDGLNRSLGELEKAGVVDLTKFNSEYRGIGSRHYDIVTDQLELTAEYCADSVRKLFEGTNSADDFEKL